MRGTIASRLVRTTSSGSAPKRRARRTARSASFTRHQAHIAHQLARVGKAHEVLQLDHQRHRRAQLHPAQRGERLHQKPQGPIGQGVAQGLLEPTDTRRGLGNGVWVLLKADLLRGVLHLQRGQPTQVGGHPGALARICDAVAKQQALQAMTRVPALAYRVLAGTSTRSRTTSSAESSTRTAVSSLARARRRQHDFAGQALQTQVAPDAAPAGPGFVHDLQWRAAADQFVQRLVQRGKTRSPPMLPTGRTSPSRPASDSAMSMLSLRASSPTRTPLLID